MKNINLLKVLLWLLVFTIISYLFVIINHYETPQGHVGSLSFLNVIASSIYILAWLVIAIWSGQKKFKEVLIAALIYSIYPFFLIFFSLFPIKLNILFIIGWIWTLPIQGFLMFNDNFIKLIYFMTFIQPTIFLVGYFKSKFY